MDNHKFLQNKNCPYFPCHSCKDPEHFSCLFCYCPLYVLGEQCGGNFTYTKDGIKDCSNCLIPHCEKNYDLITEKTAAVIALVKK